MKRMKRKRNDGSPIGHIVLDRAGVIRELDLRCASLFGKERRSLRGRPLRAALVPRSRKALDEHVGACFDSRQPANIVLAVRLADRSLRAIELVSVPPPPNADRSATFHSAVIDVSERQRAKPPKRAEPPKIDPLRLERQARRVAESSNHIKDQFLAIISHELRTPLAPMVMWVNALRTGSLSDPLRARALEAIDTCLKVQVAMIDDLIDVARGRTGKLRIERRPMDLQAVVGAAIEALAPSAAAKHIEITLEADPAPTRVSGDPIRLQQVVTNLLSNAIKFTPEAGHVAVSLQTRDAHVVLRVRDDGEGIDNARLDGIFESFGQHDDMTARRHGGLGLGLAIARQLVAQHDGEVLAASDGPGRGSCFTVILPSLRGTPPGSSDALQKTTPAHSAASPFPRGKSAAPTPPAVEDAST